MTASISARHDATHRTRSFEQGLRAWQAGEHDEAQACCTELLAANPLDPDVLHLAGVLQIARDNELARELLNRALAVREGADILVSLALTYEADGAAQGQALLERALELDPQYVHALNNLANLRAARGDYEQAFICFERLLAIDPDNALAHYNYGCLLLANGEAGRALAPLRRAVELDTTHLNAWNNLASALTELNQHEEALALLERMRASEQGSSILLTTLGNLHRALGRHDEARAVLTRALELEPQNALAWNNLGSVFMSLGQLDEAQRLYSRAIELQPDNANAHGNLAGVLKATGDIEGALTGYRRSLACAPGNRTMHSNLAYSTTFATDDAAAIRAEAEAYSARQEAPLLEQAVSYENTPDRGRRLRIGYLSPDFRGHCQSLFTIPLFAHHDHRAFEIVCYSTVAKRDEVTHHVAAFTDDWRDVRSFDDEQIAQQIRDDRIDVLVDLTMHMEGARRLVFARRPAPVQVAWLAYPGTTGSRAMGWRLTDPWLDPLPAPGSGVSETPEALAAYTERSLRLPETFWCYDALAPGIEVGSLPALDAGHITFGCLNNPCKLTDATLALWSGVFAALPQARLILMAPEGAARKRLAERLAAHGIQPERVRFLANQPRLDYLRTYAQIDIALDTVPYSGHTTSLDAFWMGVPVPTRLGRAVAGRAGLTLLANLGLRELVAQSDADYVRIVTDLARDLPRLAALRAGLRTRMEASPLMDGARFARHMEAAYRHMWSDWCTTVEGETSEAPLALDGTCMPAGLALGNLLRGQGRRAESEAAFRDALEAAPNEPQVLNDLGTLLAEDGRHAEALALMERAVALRPDFTDAWCNLGSVLMETGRDSEAINAFQRATELAPNIAYTNRMLAGLLMKAGETSEAVKLMRHAIACDPADEAAYSDLVYATMFVSDDGAAIRAETEGFFRQHEAALFAVPATHANERDPARRLRIGYVSPDFRNHCQSLFTLPLLANHDHSAYEIVCYASVQEPDPITQRIIGHVDLWRDVHALDDAQIAQQVRDDGIDILVDLTMHMASARRRLFAMRPAPVQVAWLAYPGTTGSPAIDWRITDPRLDPPGVPGGDEQYTERALRLPDTFWCYAPLDEADRAARSGALPALSTGHVTFGCLNNPCKLTDVTLALWSRVFAALPEARLILLAPPGSLRERLMKRLAAHGIDCARVRFVGYQKRFDYLQTYAQIDIGLETFPYNGHTTSLDAFRMGVPVPTRAGRVAASRAGLSLLSNLGLTELAARDDDDYVRIVTALANDLPRLAALRAELPDRMQASPLMDGPRFARAMEGGYRQMWQAWCDEAPPRAA
jgi:predicted O-linked N-acetylglucosamine transferase (SPINDLY family)